MSVPSTVAIDTFDVVDPATETAIDRVPNLAPEDATAAADGVAHAQPGWAARSPRARAEILRSIYERLHRDHDRLAALIVAENGKTLRDAQSEVAYGAEFFRWFAEEAVRIEGTVTIAPDGEKRILVESQPAGVAALVTPWNFPLAMATRKLAPALAAGCGVVLKPASETPLSALAVAELCRDAGVPDGLVEVVTTKNPGPVVDALLAHERVRVLSFTGSTEVGRRLLHSAAERALNCSMELGGNAPFIVCADADLRDAVDGAMVAKFRNGGAACTAANRFIVHEAVAPAFTEQLAARMATLRMGPGADPSTEIGPLVSRAEQSNVERLVGESLARGAHAPVGGTPIQERGFFVAPTMLTALADTDPILETEIFGPVAPIVTFADEDAAVALANRTPQGLVAYLYTGDLRRGLQLAERLEVGMVGLNRGLVSDPAAPFGGWKQSGIGREGGHAGIHAFLETKYIAVSW